MMSLNLWRAEWLKTRKRPANLGILLVMVVIMLVVIIALTAFALLSSSPEYRVITQQIFPFPNGLVIPVQVLSAVGEFIAVIFIANSVGSEYSRDTWKMILPRQGSRLGFLTTKLIVGLCALVTLIIILMIVTQVAAWIGAIILGHHFVQSTESGFFSIQLKGLTFTSIQMIFYGALTLVATITTRSTIGGIVAGVMTSVLLSITTGIDPIFARILPFTHLDNINIHWIARDPLQPEQFNQALDLMRQMFGAEVSPTTSLLVVLGYIVVLIGSGMYLFKRRDMAGN